MAAGGRAQKVVIFPGPRAAENPPRVDRRRRRRRRRRQNSANHSIRRRHTCAAPKYVPPTPCRVRGNQCPRPWSPATPAALLDNVSPTQLPDNDNRHVVRRRGPLLRPTAQGLRSWTEGLPSSILVYRTIIAREIYLSPVSYHFNYYNLYSCRGRQRSSNISQKLKKRYGNFSIKTILKNVFRGEKGKQLNC